MIRKQFNGIWATELRSPDGASALIADHGAHLLSWQPAGGGPALYLSERSTYGGNRAIRGGVPIIFPQFGERGNGRHHGFARLMTWRQDFAGVEQGRAVARFSLHSDHAADSGWPHRFALDYEVALSADHLQMSLCAHNPSEQTWEFTAALHTYLRVSDLDLLSIDGLQHARFLDKTRAGATAVQDQRSLRIQGETDRVYLDVREPIVLSDADRVITVAKQGFVDAVVWNPWQEKSSRLADMAAGDYRSFVCVEAATVAVPVTLGKGETWRGTQDITIKENKLVQPT